MKRSYDSKILFDPLILPLRESIGLRMEGGREILLDVELLCEGGSEV